MSSIRCSTWASNFKPARVMRVSTNRRSSPPRVLAISFASSSLSRRRVTSGTCRTNRTPISLRHRPSGSEPRRIRRTLYWVAVIRCGLSALSKACSSSAAVRWMLRCASSLRLLNGLRCFSSVWRAEATCPDYVLSHLLSNAGAAYEKTAGRLKRPADDDDDRMRNLLPTRTDDRSAETIALVAGLDALGELPAAQAEVLHAAFRTQLAATVVCCGFRTKAERHQHGGSQPDAQTPDFLPARERFGQRLG